MPRTLVDDNEAADLHAKLTKHYQGKQQKLTIRLMNKSKVSSSGLFLSVAGKHSPSMKWQNCCTPNCSIALLPCGLFCDSKPDHTSDLCIVTQQASRNKTHEKVGSPRKVKRITVDLQESVIVLGFRNRTNCQTSAPESTHHLNMQLGKAPQVLDGTHPLVVFPLALQ